ncbi:hypothetical protein EMIT0P201_60334 [Pseudomonas chlororaphis]
MQVSCGTPRKRVTSNACETHKSFRDRTFKPHESNFRAETSFVADGYAMSQIMKIGEGYFHPL